jgi:hypothetical protein
MNQAFVYDAVRTLSVSSAPALQQSVRMILLRM